MPKKDERVGQTFEGRCMKEQAQKEFTAEAIKVWSNGMEVAVGPCPECGTKINRILGKKK